MPNTGVKTEVVQVSDTDSVAIHYYVSGQSCFRTGN